MTHCVNDGSLEDNKGDNVKKTKKKHGVKRSIEDWLAFASLQRTRVVREVRALCEEIVEKIAGSPVFAHREELVQEARHNLEALITRLNAGTLLDKAIDSAKMRTDDLLSFFNVPSQRELKQLQRKLNQIESRLNAMRQAEKGRRDLPASH